jgi:hypothetical protein
LIEKAPNLDTKKTASGLWRPTVLGVSFVRREVAVKERSWTFDKKLFGYSGKRIRIDEVEGFDYAEMMRHSFVEADNG